MLVAAGVIPDTYSTIYYARPRDAEPLRIWPNPGGADAYRFSFAMPAAFSGALGAGRGSLRWSPADSNGRPLGQGVYFARLIAANGATKTAKFIHLR